MRAPLCCDLEDICPVHQGIASDVENNCDMEVLGKRHSSKVNLFGICLKNIMETSPKLTPQIPFLLSRLCRYLEEHGLQCKHLFMKSVEENVLENLKLEFLESGDAPLETEADVATVSKLLLLFFEELPEPLIPFSIQPAFIKGIEDVSLDEVSQLKQLVNQLPTCVYHVLKYLCYFLVQVASYEEYNGMNSDSLGLIFGPLLFRMSSDDSKMLSVVKNVINCLLENYYIIFGDEALQDSDSTKPLIDRNSRRQVPCPSSVVPDTPLPPLSVVIPPVDSSIPSNGKADNIPVLIIERQTENLEDISSRNSTVKDSNNRKRKESKYLLEEFQPRSSSEERSSPGSVTSLRKCSSHEDMKGLRKSKELNQGKVDVPICSPSFFDASGQLTEKYHSPHPPNAKRREVEMSVHYNRLPWDSPNHSNELNDKSVDLVEDHHTAILEPEDSLSVDSGLLSDSEAEKCKIPRSASCPVPKSDNHGSEEESSSLSLSWSMLFESEEPVRSDHRYSWPLTKDQQDDAALLSPSVQSLRKSDFSEAPLSPSAYRSYLSYRSHHLDPNIPPSPPVEQDYFIKNSEESTSISDSIKHLTKKIHNIKKKLRKFDEKFEQQYGYKPSHAEKASNADTRKYVNDLCKLRKELKALKEESHLQQACSWHPSKYNHVLGDSTNQTIKDAVLVRCRPSLEDSYGMTMKNLADERRLANRPDLVEAMTTEQVKDEKLSIQRALLQFESVHGKPSSKEDRNKIRPLYDRYRSIKRLLVRSGSFPGAVIKSKDICTDLQPILEHETMDFTSPQHTSGEEISLPDESKISELEESPKTMQNIFEMDDSKNACQTNALAAKYDNSSIHELPLSEMLFQLQQVKSQKRHLRKVLREFESEFLRQNGRKVQKEDKIPVDALYNEYKHVKARLKLLEALISKHDQHQLM